LLLEILEIGLLELFLKLLFELLLNKLFWGLVNAGLVLIYGFIIFILVAFVY
jgi:hypothetical protein